MVGACSRRRGCYLAAGAFRLTAFGAIRNVRFAPHFLMYPRYLDKHPEPSVKRLFIHPFGARVLLRISQLGDDCRFAFSRIFASVGAGDSIAGSARSDDSGRRVACVELDHEAIRAE